MVGEFFPETCIPCRSGLILPKIIGRDFGHGIGDMGSEATEGMQCTYFGISEDFLVILLLGMISLGDPYQHLVRLEYAGIHGQKPLGLLDKPLPGDGIGQLSDVVQVVQEPVELFVTDINGIGVERDFIVQPSQFTIPFNQFFQLVHGLESGLRFGINKEGHQVGKGSPDGVILLSIGSGKEIEGLRGMPL
ncbi:hypothetical protein ES703_117599 [subsurface metagenome]